MSPDKSKRIQLLVGSIFGCAIGSVFFGANFSRVGKWSLESYVSLVFSAFFLAFFVWLLVRCVKKKTGDKFYDQIDGGG